MDPLDGEALRTVVDQAPSGLLLVDGRGRIAWLNGEIERMTGRDQKSLVGESIETLVPPRFREAHVAQRGYYEEQPVRRPMGTGLQLVLLGRDGQEVPVDISLTPVRINGEEMILAAVLDISARHKAELAARDAERDGYRSLARMASFVAHQVNTPLTNISLLTSAIERSTSDPKLRKQLESIHEQRRAATAIVRNLMSIARIQSVVKEDTDLRTVLESAVEVVRPSVPPGVALVQDYADQHVVISLDPLQMREAFVNLLKNAIEATPTGTVTVRLVNGGPLVRVMVSDTGVGIAPEAMQKLFTPFFTTKGDSGTGLGLAYAKGVVTAHGGYIEVASVPGEGSTFTVSLVSK